MRVISWNLNGLNASYKSGEFSKVEDLSPDVVCCQEVRTWQEMEVLEGYTHIWNHGKREGYSGTLTMTWDEPLRTFHGLGDDRLDEEGRVITVEYPQLYIVNAYAPNSQRGLRRYQYRLDWDEAFQEHLRKLKADKPVVACGDFNAPRLRIDVYPENQREFWAMQGYESDERAGLDTILDMGFVDAFRHLFPDLTGAYTWWSQRRYKRLENRGWRLDYFFVSDDLTDKIKAVRHRDEIMGSDHCPIELELAL